MNISEQHFGLILKSEEINANSDSAKQELEDLAYAISHDFRAPIRHIQGFAEILKDKAENELSEDNMQYLKKLIYAGEKLEKQCEALLEYSRAGRREIVPRKIDSNILVDNSLEALRARYPDRNISFETSQLPSVKADPEILQQIFYSLLSNAVKFTSNRSEAVIKVNGKTHESEVVFKFQDNGVGFDPERSSKLFKVFGRLHRDDEFPGIGMGLALAKRGVSRHGGRIWAFAKKDEGATFYISIPS